MVYIRAAKTHLGRLVDEAEAGDDIVIAQAGPPCVRLVPVERDAAPRELGRLRGAIRVADDFDPPLPEIERPFAVGSPRRVGAVRADSAPDPNVRAYPVRTIAA